MNTFKIEGSGIDTSHFDINMRTELLNSFDYVYTKISANNDYRYGSSIKPGSEVITYVDFTDGIDNVLQGHLDTICRKRSDILLVDAGILAGPSHEDVQAKRLTLDWGIQGTDLEEIKKTYGSFKARKLDINYLAIPLCPFEFDPEILEWADSEKIDIIGLNPMGGWLSAARNISAFSVPYLLGFASTYCKIVILSGRDPIKSGRSADYLADLVGKESSSIYSLKKSVHKGIKPIKTAVKTLANIGGLVVEYNNPELVLDFGDVSLNLNLPKKSEEESDEKLDVKFNSDNLVGFMREADDYLKSLSFPSDAPDSVRFALARYRMFKYLEASFKGYSMSVSSVGPAIIEFTLGLDPITTGSFWWKKTTPGETKQFCLLNKGKAGFEFIEIPLQ